MPWAAYLRPDMESAELWRGIYDRVVLPAWALEGFRDTPIRRLLVLAADWCGDAVNTVPVLAGLADRLEKLELGVLDRDRFPELMERYLTNGTRSIPIAIALDEEFRELGHWGPRPAALQAWMVANQATIPTPKRYAYARRWYAKDKGETTLREVLDSVKTPTRSPSKK
jgi:hypothetical protein